LVVDSLSLETPKTKEFLQYVEQRKLGSQSILMITDEVTENLYLATRNLFNVEIVDTNEVNPYVMMKFEKVLITEKAMTQLEERLK
jgi:large subunit ribosomal protein L4